MSGNATDEGGQPMMTAAIQSAEGERLKLAAHALLSARREAVVRQARRALLTVLLQRGECTIDDVRREVAVPEGIDPVCIGAVPGALALLRIIEHAGFAKTNRAAAHARPVSIWRLRDREAALRWLAAHPEREALPEQSHTAEPLTLFNMDPNAATDALTSVGRQH